jgi:hypothetical protein
MANKVRWLASKNDVLDDATVSVSSETDGLGGINVQDELVRRVYRTTGRENEYVTLQASGGQVGLNVVHISNFSVTKDAVILWQGNSTSNFASGPALSVTLAMATDGTGNPIRKITHYFDSVQTHEFWRLYWEDSGNPSTNIEVGRILAGEYTEPQYNMRDGFSMTPLDPSRFSATKGRQGYANVKRQYYQVTYSVSSMPETQQNELLALYACTGKYAPLLLSLDPETRPHHNSYYCQFMNDPTLQHRFGREMDLSEITFEEKN